MSTNDNTDALPPLEQQIDEYIDGYTLEGDDGYYTPNDTERLIAKDVVMGLLAEPWFVAALAAQQGAQVPQDAARKLVNNFARACCFGDDAARIAAGDALVAALSASPQAPAQPEPSDRWYGAEEWMPLAWELCADECGEEACNELVWEGGAVPEPWGERWLKYEDEAKRLIALVRKHVPAAAPAVPASPQAPAQREPFNAAQRRRLWDNSPEIHADAKSFAAFERIVQLVEAARGITKTEGTG